MRISIWKLFWCGKYPLNASGPDKHQMRGIYYTLQASVGPEHCMAVIGIGGISPESNSPMWLIVWLRLLITCEMLVATRDLRTYLMQGRSVISRKESSYTIRGIGYGASHVVFVTLVFLSLDTWGVPLWSFEKLRGSKEFCLYQLPIWNRKWNKMSC